MKLAICARSEGLDAPVDQRFGRCACFVVVDPESEAVVESIHNDQIGASGGAGPQSAQLLSERGVDAVALGNVGPNAAATLRAAGIDIYTGIAGSVKETLQRYKQGRLESAGEATVSSHSGLRGGDQSRGDR